MLPEPEVRRVALPSKGARLIIASDGLWDAINPKTAAHHVRGMQAGKAAGELVGNFPIMPDPLSASQLISVSPWFLATTYVEVSRLLVQQMEFVIPPT